MDDRPSVLKPAIDPAWELSGSDLFWEAHWKKFAWGLAGVVVFILAFGVWQFWTARMLGAAGALYSTASTPEAWREVVSAYPGTVPAGNAQLRLAGSLRAGGDLAGAAVELENLLAAQPAHPLAAAAWLTLGELRQIQGNNEGALEAYRGAASGQKTSYAAPLALLAEAKLLAETDRAAEARAVLSSVGTLYPDTPAAFIASAELARMSPPESGVSPAGN